MTKKKIIETLQTPRAVRWFWILIISPIALILILLFLIRIGVFGKLPTFEELENPKSNLATEIYSQDGEMIGSFFVQNRSYVDYEELSPALIAALVSTEDMRFYSHSGIDFISLARVAVKTMALGNRSQGGGSTITQQLAKNLYPRDTSVYDNAVSKMSKLVISKMKEWITAVMLEYNYTKEEILTMYLNTVAYGSNAYGIKSAARTFFNKLPSELNVQEAAMLVGVVNAPTRYSPRSNPDRALIRRNTVIDRMKNGGYLTRHQRDSIKALPIELDFQPISHNAGTGTYFRAMLQQVMTSDRPSRKAFAAGVEGDWEYDKAVKQWEENPLYGWCQKNTKANGQPYDLYRDGLKIYTTIDASMQRYAEEAVWEQMSETVQPKMDQTIKARRTIFSNITDEEEEAIMHRAMRNSDRYRFLKSEGASDQEIERAFNTPVKMRVFDYGGDRDTLMTPKDSLYYYKNDHSGWEDNWISTTDLLNRQLTSTHNDDTYHFLDYVQENILPVDVLNQANGMAYYCTGIVFKAQYQPAGINTTDGTFYRYNGNFYASLDEIKNVIGNQSISENNLSQFGIAKYQDGICYYTYFIKHAEDRDDTTVSPMEYAIVRNNIYQVNVTGINDIGSVTPTDYRLNLECTVTDWVLEDEITIDFSNNYYGEISGVIVVKDDTDVLVAYSQDNEVREARFTFNMEAPVGVGWTAHLTNPNDFEFVSDYHGVGGGGPVTLQIRPRRPFEEGVERATEMYITIDTDNSLLDFNVDSDKNKKFPGDGDAIRIRQVSTIEYDNQKNQGN